MTMNTMNQTAFYRYDPDGNNFAGFALKQDDYEVSNIHSTFESISSTWKPLILDALDDSPSDCGDFPTLVDRRRIPLFSERAWNVFEPHLSEVVEALPTTTTNGIRLLMIHVYVPLSSLIEERCSFDRFSDGGIRRVNEFCFDWTSVNKAMIIKLPAEFGGDLLVGHRFREIALENGLQGLNFVEVPQCD